MSATVRQHGFIAVLLRPIEDEEAREELSEKLHDAGSKLGISYDGSLVFYDANRQEDYEVRENIYGLFFGHDVSLRAKMEAELLTHNLMIDGRTMRPYNCIYWNGSDSPLSLLTKEQFFMKTDQI